MNTDKRKMTSCLLISGADDFKNSFVLLVFYIPSFISTPRGVECLPEFRNLWRMEVLVR